MLAAGQGAGGQLVDDPQGEHRARARPADVLQPVVHGEREVVVRLQVQPQHPPPRGVVAARGQAHGALLVLAPGAVDDVDGLPVGALQGVGEILVGLQPGAAHGHQHVALPQRTGRALGRPPGDAQGHGVVDAQVLGGRGLGGGLGVGHVRAVARGDLRRAGAGGVEGVRGQRRAPGVQERAQHGHRVGLGVGSAGHGDGGHVQAAADGIGLRAVDTDQLVPVPLADRVERGTGRLGDERRGQQRPRGQDPHGGRTAQAGQAGPTPLGAARPQREGARGGPGLPRGVGVVLLRGLGHPGASCSGVARARLRRRAGAGAAGPGRLTGVAHPSPQRPARIRRRSGVGPAGGTVPGADTG